MLTNTLARTARRLPTILAGLGLILSPIAQAAALTPMAAVDPFIGTGGEGHTFPGAVAPFGMVQLSPDTDATCEIRK